jgi:hypothetical protein
MTMDALELLSQAGQVEPADQAALEAARQRFSDAVAADARPGGRGPADARWRRLPVVATAAALTAAAAAFLVVAGPQAATHQARPRSSRPAVAAPRTAPGKPSVAAVLAAFSASSHDILMVTKTMSGDEGTLGKTVIWVAPAGPAPGAPTRSRILSYTLAGKPDTDIGVSFSATSRHPPRAALTSSGARGSGCCPGLDRQER